MSDDTWPRRTVVAITQCGGCRDWQLEYEVTEDALVVAGIYLEHAIRVNHAKGLDFGSWAMATLADITMTLTLNGASGHTST